MIRPLFLTMLLFSISSAYALFSFSPTHSPPPLGTPHGSPFGDGVRYTVTAGFLDPTYTAIFHKVHTGIDLVPIGYQRNTAVILYATLSGKLYHFSNPCTGQAVIIVNKEYMVYLGHIATYLAQDEQNVSFGNKIATMGDSGTCTTGTHVHYEIHKKIGNSFMLVDPAVYLR